MGNVLIQVLAIFTAREENLSTATAEISAFSELQMDRFVRQKYKRNMAAIYKKIKAKLPNLRNKQCDEFEVLMEVDRYFDKLDRRNILPRSIDIMTEPNRSRLEVLIEVNKYLEIVEQRHIFSRSSGLEEFLPEKGRNMVRR